MTCTIIFLTLVVSVFTSCTNKEGYYNTADPAYKTTPSDHESLVVANEEPGQFRLSVEEAGDAMERIKTLREKFLKSRESSLNEEDYLKFPTGAFEDKFFTSSNGIRYRMISTSYEDLGQLWIHFTMIHPNDSCLSYAIELTLRDVDTSGQEIFCYGWSYGLNICSKELFDASSYFNDVARQTPTPANWMIGEFEKIAKEIAS